MRVVTLPPEFPPAAAGSPADPLIARTAGLAMHELSELIATAPKDAALIQPPIVRLGVPWKTILDAADERDVDLIVLGSHGYQGWDRILGTTAGKVANMAERNVLIAHERRQPPSTQPENGSMASDESGNAGSERHGARSTRRERARA